jgi:hypothetical protein
MAVDIRAAADAEVQEMVAALNHSLGCHDDTAAHSGIENGGTVHGDVGSSSSSNVSTADKATATLHGKGAVSTSGNSSSVAGRSRSTAVHQQYTSNTGVAQQYRLEPWDVEYCQQYLQAGTLQYSEVQQYLTLAGVLQGLSSVTDSLFGVRLRVVHIPSNFQPPALKKQGGAAGLPDLDLPPKVWSPDVVTLLVEVESAGHTEGHMQGMMQDHPCSDSAMPASCSLGSSDQSICSSTSKGRTYLLMQCRSHPRFTRRGIS